MSANKRKGTRKPAAGEELASPTDPIEEALSRPIQRLGELRAVAENDRAAAERLFAELRANLATAREILGHEPGGPAVADERARALELVERCERSAASAVFEPAEQVLCREENRIGWALAELSVLGRRFALLESERPIPGPLLTWTSRALALIFGHGREWPVDQLADTVGRSRSALYRDPRVRQALKARRTPGGSIGTGSVAGERRRR